MRKEWGSKKKLKEKKSTEEKKEEEGKYKRKKLNREYTLNLKLERDNGCCISHYEYAVAEFISLLLLKQI